MTFYTYLWLRDYPCPHCGQMGRPYYAGKGKGDRGLRSHGHRFSCPRNRECIILQEWSDEASAFDAEKILIAMYGRIDNGTGCLNNLTDGGEGPTGSKWSERRRSDPKFSENLRMAAKLREERKRQEGFVVSEETRKKMSLVRKGKKPSVETKLIMSKAAILREISKKERGYVVSDDTRSKMREAQKHRLPISKETRLKMSEATRLREAAKKVDGHIVPKEVCQKISKAMKDLPRNSLFKVALDTFRNKATCTRWNIGRGKSCTCGHHFRLIES